MSLAHKAHSIPSILRYLAIAALVCAGLWGFGLFSTDEDFSFEGSVCPVFAADTQAPKTDERLTFKKGTATQEIPVKTLPKPDLPAKSSMTSFVENDLYIFTPGLAEMMRHYVEGKIEDMDALTVQEIAKSPNVPSTHFWGGFVRVRRLLLDTENHKYDNDIKQMFEQCIVVSKAVEHSVPYYRDGAVFYGAACQAGLGMYYGIRRDYLKARYYGVRALDGFRRSLKARPKASGPLLAMGIFNFYTGRLGKFSKAMLTLAGIKPGDKKLGFQQIEQSAESAGPLHFFAQMFHIHINAPFRNLHHVAEREARKFIKWYPDQPDSHLILGYVLIKRGKFTEAKRTFETVLKLLHEPPASYKDETWGFSAELNRLRLAYAACAIRNDETQLKYLAEKALAPGEAFKDAPIIAHMYLGNLFSFAGLDARAHAFYVAGRDNFSCCEWSRDQMAKFANVSGRKRIPHSLDMRKRLKLWLNKHPEVQPKK